MRELPITLPSLAIATVKVSERMAEVGFDTLIATIEAWKNALATKENQATAPQASAAQTGDE